LKDFTYLQNLSSNIANPGLKIMKNKIIYFASFHSNREILTNQDKEGIFSTKSL